MAKVVIDNTEYDTDNFNEEAKQNLISLQFVQNEIKRMQAQMAVYRKAESGYAKALKENIE